MTGRSGISLLFKEGLGEVETWSGNMWVCTLQLVASSTTLPHLNPPLTKGRKVAERHFAKAGGARSHGTH
jgi:hypothetical protein